MGIYIKRVFTWSARERKVRLVRFLWRGDTRALSVGLKPSIFRFVREYGEWRLSVLGAELHYLRGGLFPR